MIAKLKAAWLAFNHWRRSAFPFRLTVLLLLLVFSTGLFERAITGNHSPLINELVWIACQAIRNACEPSVESAYLHYYRARENQRLQSDLRARIQSGGLSLSPDELASVNAMPSKVDNKLIFDIAKRSGIISAGVSQREYMRSLWAASLSMTAMEFDKDWDEVKQAVFNTGRLFSGQRDWQAGVELFVYILIMIAPIPLTATVPWFVLCLTLAFIAVRNPLSRPQRILAIVLPVLLTLIWTSRPLIDIFQTTGYRHWDYSGTLRFYYIAYFLILSVITGILGIRLRKWTVERGNTDKILAILLFIAGALLIFHQVQCNHEALQYTYWWGPPGNILFNNSFVTMLLFCLTGTVMIGCAVKLCFRRKVKT